MDDHPATPPRKLVTSDNIIHHTAGARWSKDMEVVPWWKRPPAPAPPAQKRKLLKLSSRDAESSRQPQDDGSRFVPCPACGRNVIRMLLGCHLDQDCQSRSGGGPTTVRGADMGGATSATSPVIDWGSESEDVAEGAAGARQANAFSSFTTTSAAAAVAAAMATTTPSARRRADDTAEHGGGTGRADDNDGGRRERERAREGCGAGASSCGVLSDASASGAAAERRPEQEREVEEVSAVGAAAMSVPTLASAAAAAGPAAKKPRLLRELDPHNNYGRTESPALLPAPDDTRGGPQRQEGGEEEEEEEEEDRRGGGGGEAHDGDDDGATANAVDWLVFGGERSEGTSSSSVSCRASSADQGGCSSSRGLNGDEDGDDGAVAEGEGLLNASSEGKEDGLMMMMMGGACDVTKAGALLGARAAQPHGAPPCLAPSSQSQSRCASSSNASVSASAAAASAAAVSAGAHDDARQEAKDATGGAIEDGISRLGQELVCAICTDVFDDPQILPCGRECALSRFLSLSHH